MKTKFIMVLPVLCLFLMSFQSASIDILKVNNYAQALNIIGIYDGNEGYGYNFITTQKGDNSDITMTFQKVDAVVMKEFDLDADLFLNQKFEVTYTVKKVVTKDENGFDDEEEVFTITQLKAL